MSMIDADHVSNPQLTSDAHMRISRSAVELRERQKLIDEIESYVGTMDSIPYEQILTIDLQRLLEAVKN